MQLNNDLHIKLHVKPSKDGSGCLVHYSVLSNFFAEVKIISLNFFAEVEKFFAAWS